ncbi:SDR family NAD(P)-dependent oxidoreductase [Micromonospora sp. KC721]|uniref:SDR family NAD(P)-dependent oxidoreductase n=1 Tax=Micromonospora sp. KC721 TaxID=2530380 RepID=UPI00104D81EF|nr:glucose 1-dehydrogenase [Micromonospora sp. KC721]TDB80723.1 glucose 1-dehydrogenase [Micromonospora sp. KC721]
MNEFNDMTVLITGGGRGMGLATARRLLDKGACVVLAARDSARLTAAATQLDAGERVMCAPTDVGSTGDLDRLMDGIRERFGSLDGVFANAGIGLFAPAAELGVDDFANVMDVNVKGVFFTVQKALPLMADGGSVVINASWTAHRGMSASSLYSASKAAVLHLARAYAAEVAQRGIRVNSVSPGFIVTDMFHDVITTSDAREAARVQVPMGRLGEPDDIAGPVVFLLSPQASYITGQDLIVDGGLVSVIADRGGKSVVAR